MGSRLGLILLPLTKATEKGYIDVKDAIEIFEFNKWLDSISQFLNKNPGSKELLELAFCNLFRDPTTIDISEFIFFFLDDTLKPVKSRIYPMLLFVIDESIFNNLEDGEVNELIRNEFENYGYPLSNKAIVTNKNEYYCRIEDGCEHYHIQYVKVRPGFEVRGIDLKYRPFKKGRLDDASDYCWVYPYSIGKLYGKELPIEINGVKIISREEFSLISIVPFSTLHSIDFNQIYNILDVPFSADDTTKETIYEYIKKSEREWALDDLISMLKLSKESGSDFIAYI